MNRRLISGLGAVAVLAAVLGMLSVSGCHKEEAVDATKSGAPPPSGGSTAPALAPKPTLNKD